MRYFIGYAFQDEEKNAIDALRIKISKEFLVQEALKIPPHITLVYPFETNNITPLQTALASFVKTQPPIELTCTGFNSFGQTVWFLDIEQKPELFLLKKRLADILQRVLSITEDQKNHDVHFHCTLAYKDVSSEIFFQIGHVLTQEPLPITHVSLNNLQLFRYSGNRWTSCRSFHLEQKN